MISFSCPFCGNPIRAGDEFAGRKGKCPRCGKTVHVPSERLFSEPPDISLPWEEGLDGEINKTDADGLNAAMADSSMPPLPDVHGDVIEEMLNEAANDAFLVTTCDIHVPYVVIGPVYFQVSNKGVFSSHLTSLVKQYQSQLAMMKSQGQIGRERADWGFLYGEWSVGQSDFEKAFYVAVEELKKRARMVGADAIIGLRQDIDIDTQGFQYFYLQMYGTAVRRIKK
jgi:hypothetical protein